MQFVKEEDQKLEELYEFEDPHLKKQNKAKLSEEIKKCRMLQRLHSA